MNYALTDMHDSLTKVLSEELEGGRGERAKAVATEIWELGRRQKSQRFNVLLRMLIISIRLFYMKSVNLVGQDSSGLLHIKLSGDYA